MLLPGSQKKAKSRFRIYVFFDSVPREALDKQTTSWRSGEKVSSNDNKPVSRRPSDRVAGSVQLGACSSSRIERGNE